MRYNYLKWKIEFFGSKHTNLSDFLREKKGQPLGGFGGNSRKHFRGWAKEKKMFLKEIRDRARIIVAVENAKYWKDVLAQVKTARINGICALCSLLCDHKELKYLAENDITTLISILSYLRKLCESRL